MARSLETRHSSAFVVATEIPDMGLAWRPLSINTELEICTGINIDSINRFKSKRGIRTKTWSDEVRHNTWLLATEWCALGSKKWPELTSRRPANGIIRL